MSSKIQLLSNGRFVRVYVDLIFQYCAVRIHSGQYGIPQNGIRFLKIRTSYIDILTDIYINYLGACDWILKMENSSLSGYLHVRFIKSLLFHTLMEKYLLWTSAVWTVIFPWEEKKTRAKLEALIYQLVKWNKISNQRKWRPLWGYIGM